MQKEIATWLGRVLPKAPFARGVSILVGGTAGAQFLAVIASPLLTRLFSPEDFGLLAVYTSLLGIITVISSLRYELAIPLPKSDSDAFDLVALSLMLVAGISAVCAIVVFFFGNEISDILGAPALAKHLWLLPVGVLFGGGYQVVNYWALRRKNFRAIAGTRLSQALGSLFLQLGGYKLGAIALIGGQALGQGIGVFKLFKNALSFDGARSVKLLNVLTEAKRYRSFPIYSTWSGLLNVAGSQLPPLMFSALFSPVAAGLYALAQRVLAVPMTVIGSAVANVFLSNAVEACRNNTISPMVLRLHNQLSQLAMPPTLILIFSGPEIFEVLFGAQWRQAGNFVQWMAPWIYIVFVASPLSTLFEILEKQKEHLLFQCVLLLTRILAIGIGAILKNLELTIALFSFGSAVCWVWFLLWINRTVGNQAVALVKSTFSSLSFALICVLPLGIGVVAKSESLAYFFLATIILLCFRYALLLRSVK